MKIFILFCSFLCSFELIVSSPITKKQLDAYNDAVEKLESSMKTIVPQVNNYFSKVHHIIKKESVKENKSFATTKLTEETGTYSDAKTTLDLDKGINDRHNNDTNRANFNENSIKVYPDSDVGPHVVMSIFNITIKSDGKTEIERVEMNSAGKSLLNNASNRQMSDIESHTVNSSQKKTLLDSDVGPHVETSTFNITIKSDGKTEIERVEMNSEGKSLLNNASNRQMPDIESHTVNSSQKKTLLDSDFGPHVETIFNITIKSDGKTEIERVEMNSAGKSLLNNVSNRQMSDIESHTVNSTQKKTSDNGNKDAVSEIEKFDQNSSKVSSQHNQTNKDIFFALEISTISQNKNETTGENSENKLLQDEHFNDSESKNSIRKWNMDISNIFSSTTSITGFYLKENNYVKNKTFNSTKHDPKNNQKNTDLKTETLLAVDPDNQNKLNEMTFEKSKTENHSKILENLENKTTSTSSGTDSPPKENGKSSVKENSKKIKYRQNEQVVTETNVIKNSTSLLNDMEVKSQINDEKLFKNENKSTANFSSTKSAITTTEDNRKKDLTSSVIEKKII